jgi:hypothetical protein
MKPKSRINVWTLSTSSQEDRIDMLVEIGMLKDAAAINSEWNCGEFQEALFCPTVWK